MWTPVHNMRSAHCDTLQGKKVAERKYAALGIALSRPTESELSLRFPFVRPRFSWNYYSISPFV